MLKHKKRIASKRTVIPLQNGIICTKQRNAEIMKKNDVFDTILWSVMLLIHRPKIVFFRLTVLYPLLIPVLTL